jgi:acetyltransferase-like isoleucine patch superfamily enzyme
MVHKIVIPQLSVNDEFVTIVEWYVKDGDKVKPDETLCLIETTKTAIDLAAPNEGFVKIRKNSGKEARINEVIGYIVSSLDIKIEEFESVSQTQPQQKETHPNTITIEATGKAKELAASLGVDLKSLNKKGGIIREKDVQEFYNLRNKRGKLPSSELDKWPSKKVNESFLKEIIKDPAFSQLSSEEKVDAYKKNGAVIGQNVSLGKGTIIIADYIEIGDDTSIGTNCYLKAEKLKIGKMAVIGNKANIVCRKVRIGDVFFSGNNVLIGGGGAFGLNSELEIGNSCLISSECIINTAEKVTLGDEVGLSPRVQIYTHNHWQNILEGYHANFAPVTIGDHSYITGNCLITPGVNIGKGCTALANSLILQDVEDYTVVAGVPAKKVKTTNTNLPPEKKDRIMRGLMVELTALLKYRGFYPEDVGYSYDYDTQVFSKPVVLTFNASEEDRKENAVLFDLTNYRILGEQNPLSDEVRNFLRKRGIRFRPIYWRYTADRGFYNQ